MVKITTNIDIIENIVIPEREIIIKRNRKAQLLINTNIDKRIMPIAFPPIIVAKKTDV